MISEEVLLLLFNLGSIEEISKLLWKEVSRVEIIQLPLFTKGDIGDVEKRHVIY